MKLKTIGTEYTRAKYECMQNYTFFEDMDFPADDDSLFYAWSRKKTVVWVRPSDISKKPLLFHAKKILTAAVDPGYFSNSWIASAVDAIVQNPVIFSFVVPPDQSFAEGYVGIFRFRIWRYGKWCEVTVDDRLPFDPEEESLLGLTSVHGDFWAPLLEKAYAKVLGKYEDLSFVQTNDAFTDFTGGLAEMYATNWNPEVMYHSLQSALQAGSFVMVYKVDRSRHPKVEQAWIHAFITDIEPLKSPPFHKHFESSEFHVRLRVTNEYLLLYKEDEQVFYTNLASELIEVTHNLTHVEGEVWMKFDAMRMFFPLWSLVHIPWYQDSPLLGAGGGINQHLRLHHGEWVPGKSAGSCFMDSNINANLRYSLTLEHPDEGLNDLQTVIIGLMQKNRKLTKHSKTTKMNSIGFHIYAQKTSWLWKKAIDFNHPVDKARYFNVKEYCRRFRLPLGNYIIVPCTLKPNRSGQYLLRILTETSGRMTFTRKLRRQVRRFRMAVTFAGYRTFLVFLLLTACLLYFVVRWLRRRTHVMEK